MCIRDRVEGSYYVTIGGATAVPSSANNYGSSLAAVNAALSRNSDLAMLAGANSSAVSPSVQTLRYSNTYNFYNYNNANLSIVQLTAKNGGLKSTQASQWQRFSNDINAAGNTNAVSYTHLGKVAPRNEFPVTKYIISIDKITGR